MMEVSTKPEYIGRTIRNNLDEGDEVAVLVDGTYYNREVTDVHESDIAHEREVVLGDPDRMHVVLVVDMDESNDPGPIADWDVWAYQFTDDPNDPTEELRPIEALSNLEDTGVPDHTLSEAQDLADEDFESRTDTLEKFREARREMDYLIEKMEAVENDELTLHEYAQQIMSYEVGKSGSLAMDEL